MANGSETWGITRPEHAGEGPYLWSRVREKVLQITSASLICRYRLRDIGGQQQAGAEDPDISVQGTEKITVLLKSKELTWRAMF